MRTLASLAPRAFPLILLLAVSGCAPRYFWAKPGSSEQDWRIDATECRVSAARDVPPNKEYAVNGGYRAPSYTTCSGSGATLRCVTTGGERIPPTIIGYDSNEQLRKDAIDLCLARRGWELLSEDEARQRNVVPRKF